MLSSLVYFIAKWYLWVGLRHVISFSSIHLCRYHFSTLFIDMQESSSICDFFSLHLAPIPYPPGWYTSCTAKVLLSKDWYGFMLELLFGLFPPIFLVCNNSILINGDDTSFGIQFLSGLGLLMYASGSTQWNSVYSPFVYV